VTGASPPPLTPPCSALSRVLCMVLMSIRRAGRAPRLAGELSGLPQRRLFPRLSAIATNRRRSRQSVGVDRLPRHPQRRDACDHPDLISVLASSRGVGIAAARPRKPAKGPPHLSQSQPTTQCPVSWSRPEATAVRTPHQASALRAGPSRAADPVSGEITDRWIWTWSSPTTIAEEIKTAKTLRWQVAGSCFDDLDSWLIGPAPSSGSSLGLRSGGGIPARRPMCEQAPCGADGHGHRAGVDCPLDSLD